MRGDDFDAAYPRMDFKTEVGEWVVSTTKLPMDHSFDDTPLWYETMVYRDSVKATFGTEFQDFQVRYTRIEEAEAGHAEVVRKLRAQESLNEEDAG